METNKYLTLVITLVVGTILITGILIPVINDSGSDSGSGAATDILYYSVPVENEEHVYSIVNDYDDDQLSSGTTKIMLDDSVMKEITWDDTSVDQNNRPDDITVPILFGEFTTDMQGMNISVTYMYYVGVTYIWMGHWAPVTSIINAGTVTMGTDRNVSYDENDITDTPYTISVIGDTISDINGNEPIIPYSDITLMLNDDGTHFYIKNPEFNSDDDITIVGFCNETEWVSEADWTMWGVACWFTGKIADIENVNYNKSMNSSENVVSLSSIADMSDNELESIDMTVTFEDNHEMEMQIDHAIVPVYEIDDGGNGGSDNDPIKAVLTVIPILLIVGMMFLVINFIMKRN